MNHLKLWCEYQKMAIKQWNEYKIDFIFIALASIISLLISLVNIEIVYTQVDDISGWTKYEVLWMLGYFVVIQCIFNVFFVNCFDVSSWIYDGKLDVLCARPRSILFQLLFAERYNVEYPIDQLLVGTGLLFWANHHLKIDWTMEKIFFFIGSLPISTIIYTSIIFIVSSISLWCVKNNYIVEFIFELEEINQYPINIYGNMVMNILTYVIPIGFVSFYPSQYILENEEFYKYISAMPFVAIAMCLLAFVSWKFWFKKYQSPN